MFRINAGQGAGRGPFGQFGQSNVGSMAEQAAEQSAPTPEQQLNKSDQQERIRARRQRIAERVASQSSSSVDASANASASPSEADPTTHLDKPALAVQHALISLASLRNSTDSSVKSVAHSVSHNEADRRKSVTSEIQQLSTRVEHEISSSENSALISGFANLAERNDALDVKDVLDKAQQASERVLNTKDQLLNELNAYLKAHDDAYSHALKQQAEEIDTLISRMSSQYRELESACLDKLKEIEDTFLLERSNLLEHNEKELESLRQEWHNQREQYQEQLESRLEEYNQELSKLREQDAEDFKTLKIRLESDIQSLEQHLEGMRATYQLNTEKLEYNYKVLIERDHENQATISQQKRKIARQRETLSKLKHKHAEAEKKYQEENQRLTEGYKRTNEQFKHLQSKLKHFKRSDMQKYSDMWNMQKEHAQSLASKVLNADSAITEQLLGLWWHGPPDSIFNSPPEAEEDGLDLSLENQSRLLQASHSADGDAGSPQQQQQIEGQECSGVDRMAALLDVEENRELVQLLCDEAAFLIDGSLPRACEDVAEDEKRHMQIKAILQSLNVTRRRSLEALKDALMPNGELVQVDEVVPVLRKLMQQLSESRPIDVATTQKCEQQQQQETQLSSAKAMKAKRLKDFWDNLAQVVDSRGERVWSSLYRELEKYHKLLKERSEQVSQVEHLQKQNSELRSLLSSHVSSSINDGKKLYGPSEANLPM